MLKTLLTTIFAIGALTGCATVDQRNPTAVAAEVTVNRDDFKKISLFYGPSAESNSNWFYLRSAQAYSGQVLTRQLVVRISGYGWSFFNTAYDSSGQQLDTTVLEREVISCTTHSCWNRETVAINLPSGYLQSHATVGMHFQVSGRKGETTVKVEPGYIQGFLSKASFAH